MNILETLLKLMAREGFICYISDSDFTDLCALAPALEPDCHLDITPGGGALKLTRTGPRPKGVHPQSASPLFVKTLPKGYIGIWRKNDPTEFYSIENGESIDHESVHAILLASFTPLSQRIFTLTRDAKCANRKVASILLNPPEVERIRVHPKFRSSPKLDVPGFVGRLYGAVILGLPVPEGGIGVQYEEADPVILPALEYKEIAASWADPVFLTALEYEGIAASCPR